MAGNNAFIDVQISKNLMPIYPQRLGIGPGMVPILPATSIAAAEQTRKAASLHSVSKFYDY
jgi:hypothetical protein